MSNKRLGSLVEFWECLRLPLGLAGVAAAIVIWREVRSGGRELTAAGLSLAPVLVGYLVAATTIGFVAFGWGSWATTRLRAAFLGFVTAATLFALFTFTISPFRPVGGALLLTMILFGVFPGSLLGAMYWNSEGR